MINRFFITVTIVGLMLSSVAYGQNTYAEGRQFNDKQYEKAITAASLADRYYREGYVEAAVENYKVFIDWCKQKHGDRYILGEDRLFLAFCLSCAEVKIETNEVGYICMRRSGTAQLGL